MKFSAMPLFSLMIPLMFTALPQAQAQTEPLSRQGWFYAECHESTGRMGVQANVSRDELDGVRPVAGAWIFGEVRKKVEFDQADLSEPQAALASVKGNDLKFYLRYANAFGWSQEVTITLRYKADHYVGSVHVYGEEGIYMDEKNLRFECRVTEGLQVNLQTPAFNKELVGAPQFGGH